MGQKVSPVGMRIGINKKWNSNWFATGDLYATFLNQDIKIREFLSPELKKAQLSHIEISRNKTVKGYKVLVEAHVGQPGIILGQEGKIKELNESLKKLIKCDDVVLELNNVKEINLDAQLVANWIASELEKRASFRTVQKKAIMNVKRAGAKGCKTVISGRLGGADIARKEGYHDGIIPLTTLRSDIDYAHAEAETTYGRLGVKVWICRGDVNEESDETKRGEK